VNGSAGAVIAPHGEPFAVMAFTLTAGKITAINALQDPERLERLDLAIPPPPPEHAD
jgi:RNA polymerase sigma-70 factor (ECF subfamily)